MPRARLKVVPKLKYRDPRDDGALCDECPLQGQTPVFGTPVSKPRLIVVGQNPGANETEAGEVFIGRAGRRLEKSLGKFGINRHDLHLTNARLCQHPYNTKAADLKKAIECCRPRLENELKSLKRTRARKLDNILTLGGAALRSVTGKTGITNRMGGPLDGTAFEFKQKVDKKTGALKGNGPEFNADFSKYLVTPTVQPALVLRAPHMAAPMTIHIGRSWALQHGQLQRWVWPDFDLHPNASMVRALKRMLKSPRPVACDLETGGTEFKHSPVRVVGLSNGRDTISSPWEAFTSKRHGSSPDLLEYPHGQEIADLIYEILETKRLVGQNFGYDLLMLKHQMDCDVFHNYWFDTLLAHRVVAPRLPHRLGFMATMEYHCPNWKTEFGDATEKRGLEKYFERPAIELRVYNAQDAYMTYLLIAPLMKRLGITSRQLDRLWHERRAA